MPSLRPVFLHIGLPKTGTTFLQRVLSENRPALADQGLLYPGRRPDHFLPAQDVLDRPFRGHPDDRAAGTWDETVREVADWSGAALISHETFTVARPDQVETVVAAFPDRPVELIVTARDLARQLTANWQETVKNGQSPTLAQYVERARNKADDTEATSGFWFWQDLVAVLQRWQKVVPADRTHLVTVPPRGTDPRLLWQRFADVLGIELSPDQLADRSDNASLGRVETEFLRRLNADLGDSIDWPAYRAHVKHFLAQRVLPRFEQSGPIVLAPDDQAWAAAQSRQVVQETAALSLTVHGDLGELESAESAAPGAEVTDEAVVDVGVRAITQLLRRIAREQGSASAKGRAS